MIQSPTRPRQSGSVTPRSVPASPAPAAPSNFRAACRQTSVRSSSRPCLKQAESRGAGAGAEADGRKGPPRRTEPRALILTRSTAPTPAD